MDRDIKNKGREKHVTSGGGSVSRREKSGSSRPVGANSSYSSRPKTGSSSSGGSYGSSSGGFGGMFGSSSGKSASGGLSLKKIIIIGIIIVVGFFILRACFGSGALDLGSGDMLSGLTGSEYTSDESSSSGISNTNSAALDTTVSNLARDKRTTILGGGQDTVTVMIYMLGSDLESSGGMATRDLNEIISADIADNVNIIVETGGASKWQNSVISSKTNQRYRCVSGGLEPLQDNLGIKIMTDPNTLSDFVTYCKTNFPANRYMLVMWDHGGGSAAGYGHDEFASNDTMTLDEIHSALSKSNVDFDLIGFDACLMATYETAVMLEQHADYMLASEETEPGIGWYYTGWVDALSDNTSIETTKLGQIIIDDFTEKCYQNSAREQTTLSLIDLAEFAGTVPEAFNAFAVSTGDMIETDQYETIAKARSGSREFGQPSRLDQVDLIHLAQNLGTDEANALIDALKGTIKYNRTSSTIADANGISIFFPFNSLGSLSGILNTYDEIGMDGTYSDTIKRFANVEAGGQAITTGSSSPFGSILSGITGDSSSLGGSLVGGLIGSLISNADFGSIIGSVLSPDSTTNPLGWVDTESMQENSDYYEENHLDSDKLVLTVKNDGYVLQLTDAEWDLIQTIELNVFLDDSEGYIDLGLDNVFDFDDDGDLIIDYDGTWLALNEQVVAYYMISEEWSGEKYTITGYVPAELNGEEVQIILSFTDQVPYGEVLGARTVYDDGSVAKGLTQLQDGDELDFLCDFYHYDETYDDSYYLGDPMTVSGDIEISNVSVGDDPVLFTYRLTDIYNNTYWLPAMMYE